MSTATAIVMMFVLVVVSTTTVIVFATASATVAVTTTATCQMLHHVVYLLFSCLTILKHSPLEVKCLASQRVVEVHLYLVLADF